MSPARAPGQSNEHRASNESHVYGGTEYGLLGEQHNSAYGVSNSGVLGFPDKEHIVRTMEEMFSHLESEVIHIVLTECDFNMETAMDSLLELSDAAKGTLSLPTPVSGFESAAALLNTGIAHHESAQTESTAPLNVNTHTPPTLTTPSLQHQPTLSTTVPLSSVPTPQSNAFPTNSAIEPDSGHAQTFMPKQEQSSQGSSPVGELSFCGGTSANPIEELDFSHLLGGPRLGGSGSAFQAYHRDDHSNEPSWNIAAPEFQPRSVRPTFVTPVIPPPMLPSHGPTYRSMVQAPLKPTATIPPSWAVQPSTHHNKKTMMHQSPYQQLRFEGKVLILLRGAPGSGKSTLARALLNHNPDGVSFNTDEYFCRHGQYQFNPAELSIAHEWNHQRAKDAMMKGHSPVIIDNTNMQSWEMKPYVAMALRYKYKVVFREPDTWWKFKPKELERQNNHGVSRDKIRQMLDGFDRHVSVSSIMGSKHPNMRTEPPLISELPRPDLLVSPPLVTLNADSAPSTQSLFLGSPPELLDNVDLYQDPQEVGESSPTEPPMAFAQSIAQRERRVRARCGYSAGPQSTAKPSQKGPSLDKEEGEVKIMGDSGDDLTLGKAESYAEVGESDETPGVPRTSFTGDWPCESLEPQGQRIRQPRATGTEPRMESDSIAPSTKGADFSEMQKLLYVIQGVGELDLTPDSEEEEKEENEEEEEEESPSTGPDTQPPSPTCLPEEPGFLPTSGQEGDTDRDDQEAKESERSSEEEKDEWEDEEQLDGGQRIEVEEEGTKRDIINDDTEEREEFEMDCETNASESKEPGELSDMEHVSDKKRANRRSGKSYRLAMTFTNQDPFSVLPPQPQHLPPHSPLLQESQHAEVSSPPTARPGSDIATQTEAGDLAQIWRLEHGGLWEGAGEKVLTGNASHFVPAASQVLRESPVRHATHERGAQVDEDDLAEARTKDEGLNILIRLFNGVPVETLGDLYEKCQQNLEWTTNLLLDSGEELSREDDDGEGTEDEVDVDDHDWGAAVTAAEQGGDLVTEPKDDEQVQESETVNHDLLNSTRDSTKVTDPSDSPPVSAQEELCRSKVALGGPPDKVEDPKPTVSDVVPELLFPHEPKSQPPMASHFQQASAQELLLEDRSTLSEHTGNGDLLQADASIEDHENRLGFQREEDQQASKNQEQEEPDASPGDTDDVTQSVLTHIQELSKREEAEQEREQRLKTERAKNSKQHHINTLDLQLPTELALQLVELFGPVGIDPGVFSDDCSVKMDLNFARLLHEKWKQTIQEKQRQEALSYHLLQESSVHWGESQIGMSMPRERNVPHFLIGSDGYANLGSQLEYPRATRGAGYKNVSQPYVSLRDIMSEEQALQDIEQSKLRTWDPELRDGAALLKEKELFSHFPTIDKLFLKDIFRHHSYSLEQTEKYLRCLLDVGPVKTVVATDAPPQLNHSLSPRAPSKERAQTSKQQDIELGYQDIEEPAYQDFRAEANVQWFKQQEAFSKAAEAYRCNKRQVASFYAQQGHLHGQKMREANHRAALCIFERVNASLLPQNVLDLHGLHVKEAVEHLARVLTEKSTEYKQGLCRPQLSVITGRGNRSQGGVARIRPAVIDYLRSKHYEFVEPNVGLVLVSLQRGAKP